MKTKKKYIAPTLKRYAYQVEGGFTNSLITNITNGDYDNGFERWGWETGGGTGNGFDEGGDNGGSGTGWGWD